MVGASYLSAFGVSLTQGRSLDEHDTSNSEPVILINQTVSNLYWKGRLPVGEYLLMRDTGGDTVRRPRIVGVVGDVKHFGLEAESTADVYVAIPQVPNRRFNGWRRTWYWGVRTLGDPSTVRESVRKEINTVDADVPASMRTMDDMMEVAVAQRRLNLWLVRVFGTSSIDTGRSGHLRGHGVLGVYPHARNWYSRGSWRATLTEFRRGDRRCVNASGCRIRRPGFFSHWRVRRRWARSYSQ